MEYLFNFLGMVAVALISLVSVIIQQHNTRKSESIETKIDKMRKESQEGDANIKKRMDEMNLSILKRYLITELTKIRDQGHKINNEQRNIIYEAKEKYNKLGGDSYVDDMFDEVKKLGLL